MPRVDPPAEVPPELSRVDVGPESVLTGPVPGAGQEDGPVRGHQDRALPGGRRHRGDQRSDLAKFARDTVIKFVGSAANGIFGFLGVVVITRGLHAGKAGAFFEAFALFTILSSIAEMGADTGFMRAIPQYRALGRTSDVRKTLLLGLAPVVPIAAIFAALMFAFAPELARVLAGHGRNVQTVIPFLRVLAPFIPLAAVTTVALAATRGFRTMVPSVVINNVFGPALRPVLVVVVLAMGLGPVAIGAAWAAPLAIGTPLTIAWLLFLLRRAERRDNAVGLSPTKPPRRLAAEFWRFSSPRAIAAVFSTLTTWLDTILVGALRSTGEAGIYTASTRYVIVGTVFIQAIVIVISPQIAGLLARREGFDRARSLLQSTTAWLVMATWPIYFTLAVFAPLFLRVFGKEFVAGQTPLMILALGVLFSTGVGPAGAVLLMGGKSSWNLINTIAALVVNVGLNLLLIPHLGMTGAAIAWVASIVVSNLLPLIQVRAFLGLSPFSAPYVAVGIMSAFLFGGLGLAVRLTLGPSLPAFLLYACVSTGLYAVVLWKNRARLHLSMLLTSLRPRQARGMGAARP